MIEPRTSQRDQAVANLIHEATSLCLFLDAPTLGRRASGSPFPDWIPRVGALQKAGDAARPRTMPINDKAHP